tara:strand:- start:439 stop:636 length:198 start_codon:yes stop_codon:yes gene_type:complete
VQGQEKDQKVPQEQEEGQVRLLDQEVQKDAQEVPRYLQRVLMLRLRRDDSHCTLGSLFGEYRVVL